MGRAASRLRSAGVEPHRRCWLNTGFTPSLEGLRSDKRKMISSQFFGFCGFHDGIHQSIEVNPFFEVPHLYIQAVNSRISLKGGIDLAGHHRSIFLIGRHRMLPSLVTAIGGKDSRQDGDADQHQYQTDNPSKEGRVDDDQPPNDDQ